MDNGAAIERTGAAAADGRLADAARAFAPFVVTGAELAALDGDFFERFNITTMTLTMTKTQCLRSCFPSISPFHPRL